MTLSLAGVQNQKQEGWEDHLQEILVKMHVTQDIWNVQKHRKSCGLRTSTPVSQVVEWSGRRVYFSAAAN